MSSKKAAALRAIKEARSKREQGLGVSRTDEYEIKDEGDVYEVLEESEYQHLVESRRQREDFVVDDDGLGYYDDGEERMGDEDGDDNRRKKRSGTTANLTADALKKARRTNAMLAEKQKQVQASSEDAANNNKSMWDFVQRGGTSSAVATFSTPSNAAAMKNVESLLDELDDVVPTSRKKRRHEYGSSSRRSYGRSPYSGSSSRRHPRTVTTTPRRYTERQHSPAEEQTGLEPQHDDAGNHDWADNNDEPAHDNMEMTDRPPEKAVDAASGEPQSQEDSSTKETQEVASKEAAADSKEEKPEENKPAPRKRFARTKLGKLSAPAQKALEAKTRREASQPKDQPTALATTAPACTDTSSASFRPDVIQGEAIANSAEASAAAANLESVLQKDKENDGESFLDMFWIDATEKNGVVHLYGKVQVPNKDKNAKPDFVSCCAVVKNNVRNLFVLPKKKENGEYESMMDVHCELKKILQPSCIPLVQGANWAGKIVKRQYAFDDSTIPREETLYFKVVYDAKYPVPSQEVCMGGGKYFDKILGAGASTLENFIVKRKLMGPCWMRIRNPQPNGVPTSWCKLELLVDTPKNISRLDLAVKGVMNRPPPPMVTVSLKLKTIVNPKTHKSEIVSVSAICHKQVLLDTASDESTRQMTQLSIIRPLHTGGNHGGMAQFPRDIDQEIKIQFPQLQRMANERALLSRLMAQIGMWDPDVIVGHNAWGYDMEIILSRCAALKVSTWSKIGRRRKMQLPSKSFVSKTKDWAIADAMSGRLLCDTYLSSKELLRETEYSLTNLAKTQLDTDRTEIEPVDIPRWYGTCKDICNLAHHTLYDAQLVQRLFFKLQIVPLTKQLTCIAGNLWSHTMKGKRAERNEYLLLHEFHQLKFVPPEKKRKSTHPNKGNGDKASGKKAKYSGGLVLEPKKGLYSSHILLLDFNSLYPSIIQEHNLCFTTMDWSKYVDGGDSSLPPLPEDTTDRGVLPRVIKSLVERRRNVKKLMKNEANKEKKQELDIRQQALKLTANSMYGCLGFSHSRFYAQPIAALVTAMGRETLQRTVDVATDTVGLEVIYGDTDSIMINTRITDKSQLPEVKKLGEKVIAEVNKLYRTIELDIDGVFRKMLLLKKKKYAALTVKSNPNGETEYVTEKKGLDMVRRDWCIQSKETGEYVLDQILSDQDPEEVVKNIHDHLADVADKMRKGELPLEKFKITKGLSKHPNDYPDGKSQPHVHVAKAMLKNNLPVNTGDHIPYIITAPLNESPDKPQSSNKSSAVERARHPDEIQRSNGVLKPDVEWYLVQQILPPVSRLCEHVAGTSQSLLAEKLGLDSKKYNHVLHSGTAEIEDDNLVDYTPSSRLSDEERFKDVQKLMLTCSACGVSSEFPGVFCVTKDGSTGKTTIMSGLQCVNPDCSHREFWGMPSHLDCLARVSNAVSVLVHGRMKEYYEGWIQCEDPVCGLKTRQLSVVGSQCMKRGCTATMLPKVSERALHNQLKYLDALFDVDHVCDKLEQKKIGYNKKELLKGITKHDKVTWDELHEGANKYLKGSAYNWIGTSLWTTLFGANVEAKQ